MPKDREKAVNPAAAQRKAEKQKAVKKGKAAVAAQRTERLAKQNPHRVQRQIDDLKALESSSGTLNARDKKQLEELERDLARIKKAKDSVGDKYERRPRDSDNNRRGGVLGKRSRDERGGHGRGRDQDRRGWDTRAQKEEPESSETDESVRNIPMPRDTPPPIPRHPRDRRRDGNAGTNANNTPLGERRLHPLPDKPSAPAQAQTVYESKPILRDLRKEATAFVPAAVKRNIVQGTKKEEGGYGDAVGGGVDTTEQSKEMGADDGETSLERDFDEDMKRLQEEEERWRMETKQAHVEEVEDEEA